MSEKRLDTVSARITPELHDRIAVLANLDGLTVSALISDLLQKYHDDKEALHQKLSRAFSNSQSLPSGAA